MSSNWWVFIPGNQGASLAIWGVIVITFMYAGRTPMHNALRALTHTVAVPLRQGALWLFRTADEMRRRNKEVLLAHGRDELKRTIEREFERIANIVQRDLHGYPELQKKLLAQATKIEEDYKKSGEVPPPTPEWAEAIETIANISPKGDGLVEKLLEDISKSIEKIYDKSMREYRASYEGRHKILKGFAPYWRQVTQTLSEVDKKIEGLQDTSKRIDGQMDRFKEIDKGSDKAENMLYASASRQFLIDTLLVGIVCFGAYINSKLISLPLSEMVDNQMVAMGLRTADVAALVIISIEIIMGVFLMEAMGLTHLFPKMGSLSNRALKRIVIASAFFLLILASVEAFLAFWRDLIAADKAAATKSLISGTEVATERPGGALGSIPMAGQMALGFILPWALAFIAIPFESFMTSVRTVGGGLTVQLVRASAFLLRISSSMVRSGSRLLISLYDVVIFAPLMIERMVRSGGHAVERRGEDRGGVTSFSKRKASAGRTTGEF